MVIEGLVVNGGALWGGGGAFSWKKLFLLSILTFLIEKALLAVDREVTLLAGEAVPVPLVI